MKDPMMDNQLFEMLTARFDAQDETLKEIKESLQLHIKEDNAYWKKIDVQEGQLSLLKKLVIGLGTGLSTIIAAVWAWLGK